MPSVGTAYVNVRISTKGFEKSLDSMMKRLSGQMEKAGADLGKDFEKGLKSAKPDKVIDDWAASMGKATTKIKGHLQSVGDKYEGTGQRVAVTSEGMVQNFQEVGDEVKQLRAELSRLGTSSSAASSSLDRVGSSASRSSGGFREGSTSAALFDWRLQTIQKAGDAAEKMMRRLYYAAAGLGTAMAGVAGGLSSAAMGIFALGSAAASATPALGVLATGLVGLASVGATLAISMQGVGAALKAGSDAAAKSAVAAQASGASNYSMALAARSVAAAERNLADAHQDTLAAQKALNAARAEGLEQLEDIGFAAESAALGEDRAALELADARDALAAVSGLAPDDRARVEAELAFKEAELNYRMAKDHRQDADKEQRHAAKTGVAGTDAMRSAREGLANAREREADANQALADANFRLAHAMEEGTSESKAATDAHDKYLQMLEELSPAQAKFVRKIDGMRKGFDKFRENLSKPIFQALNQGIKDANTESDKGVGIQEVLSKGLMGTSGSIADTIDKAADLANSDLFQGQLSSAMDSGNEGVENLGGALVNVAAAFVAVADAAGPLFEDFTAWIETVTGRWADDTTGDIDGLRGSIEKAGEKVKVFWGFLKEAWRWLKIVGGQADNASEKFGTVGANHKDEKKGPSYLEGLTTKLKNFNDALDTNDGKESAFDKFTQALENMNAAGGALQTAVIDPLITLGSDPDIAEAFKKIGDSEAFKTLGENAAEALPELTELVDNLAGLIAQMSESGSIDAFLDALDLIVNIISIPLDVVGWLSDLGPNNNWMLKTIGAVTGTLAALRVGALVLKGALGVGKNTAEGFSKVMEKLSPSNLNEGWGRLKENIGIAFDNVKTFVKAPPLDAEGNETDRQYKSFVKKEKPEGEEDAASASGNAVADAYAKGLKEGADAHIPAAVQYLDAKVRTELTTMATDLCTSAAEAGRQVTKCFEAGMKGDEAGIDAAAQSIEDSLRPKIQEIGDDLAATADTAGDSVTGSLTTSIEDAAPDVAGAFDTVENTAVTGLQQMGAAGTTAAGMSADEIVAELDEHIANSTGHTAEVWTAVRDNLVRDIEAAGTAATTATGTVGTNMMNGLTENITAGTEGARTAVANATGTVTDQFAESAETQSPSRITLKVGEDLMAGLEKGVEDATQPAVDAANQAGSDVAHAVGDDVSSSLESSMADFGPTLENAVDIEGAGQNIGSSLDAVLGGSMGGDLGGALGGLLGSGIEGGVADKLNSAVSKGGGIGKAAGGLSKAMGGIGKAMTLMSGPWGILITVLLPILLPIIIKLWKKFEVGEKIMKGLKWILEKVVDVFGWLWDKMKDLFGWLKDHWKLVFAIITGPFGLAIYFITKHWKAILEFIKKIPGWIKDFLAGMWDFIVDAAKKMWDLLKAVFSKIFKFLKGLPAAYIKILKKVWDILWKALGWAWDKMRAVFTKVFNFLKALPARYFNLLKTIWNVLTDKLGDAWTWIKDKFWDMLDWFKKLPAKVTDALGGLWSGMVEGLASALEWIFGKLNWLIEKLNGLLGKIKVDPINFTFPETVTLPTMATGGPVRGRGTGTSDSILARLSNGEHVWTAAEVRAMGGHRSVESLRKAALKGKVTDGEGGIFGSAVGALKDIGSAIKDGIGTAIKWVVNEFTDGLTQDNIIVDVVKGFFSSGKSDMGSFANAQNAEEAAAAAIAATGVGPVVPYTGPTNGWTYPLTRWFPGYSSATHNPPTAIDIGAPTGTGVRAASSGTVIVVDDKGGDSYGKFIVIQHRDGWQSLYAHLSSQAVKYLDHVTTGQTIGISGHSGGVYSSSGGDGSHLHYELSKKWGSAGSMSTRALMALFGVKMAKGGVVSPSTRGTMALLAEAGKAERVTPLDRDGFTPAERKMLERLDASLNGGGDGGDTYNVYPSQQMDETALADRIARRVAWNRRKGAGGR